MNQLISTGYAERQRDGRYRSIGAPALLTNLAFQRPMSRLLASTVMVHAPPDQVKEALVHEGCVLCLDSALEAYSAYFRSDRVCAYTTEAPRIVDGLRPVAGGLLKVQACRAPIAPEAEEELERRRQQEITEAAAVSAG